MFEFFFPNLSLKLVAKELTFWGDRGLEPSVKSLLTQMGSQVNTVGWAPGEATKQKQVEN